MIVPVLEVGGTHVSAAAVDVDTWRVVVAPRRRELDAAGPAAAIVATLLATARELPTAARPAAGTTWGIAMPDPFDYEHGIALFAGVGKFESLYGRDLGADLRAELGPVAFVNDADAFALGEWVAGAAGGTARCAGITLGTGVGSGWLVDGHVADPGVPSGGRAHHLLVEGRPLEEFMSRRAIRRAYAAATGDTAPDVREICDRARDGQAAADAVLADALHALGTALGPALTGFGAEIAVIGGSMSASWELFEPWFVEAALATTSTDLPPVVVAALEDEGPLLGAALAAGRGA